MPDETFVPPNNVAAQEAVLGSLLIDPSAVDEIAAVLKPADCYRERSTGSMTRPWRCGRAANRWTS